VEQERGGKGEEGRKEGVKEERTVHVDLLCICLRDPPEQGQAVDAVLLQLLRVGDLGEAVRERECVRASRCAMCSRHAGGKMHAASIIN
jgi:hypothetical protein